MFNELESLVNLSDKLDKEGLTKESDIIDKHIQNLIKVGKAGYHKCGLKELTINDHFKLLENYKKAFNFYQKEYKKVINSSNEINSPNFGSLRDVMQGYSHNANAVNFHEMYFEDVVSNNSFSIQKDSQMISLLKELGYDYSKFEKEIVKLANISRNGWVLFSFCIITKKLHFNVVDLHDQHIISTSIPILALDMWEHAYISDFGLDKESYVEWFLSRIDWRNPRKRIKNILRVK